MAKPKRAAAGVIVTVGLWACADATQLLTPDREAVVTAPMCFGREATIYPGHPGAGSITGSGSNLRFTGTPGADVIVGTSQDDVIEGLGGRDRICSLEGSDFLSGGAGDDFIDGGTGTRDYVDFRSSPSAVSVNLLTARGRRGDAEGDRYVGIEAVIGSPHDDVLIGHDNHNSISGGAGNDLVRGGNGIDELLGDEGADILVGGDNSDALYGGDGDDVLIGGAGGDELNGEGGNDAASYVDSPNPVNINLSLATSSGGHAAGDILDGVENLIGSEYGDDLYGDEHANRIDGRGGPDFIEGFGEADLLTGGPGVDWMVGGPGNDLLRGGDDDDDLMGDAGDDRLFGQAGNDNIYGGDDNDDLWPGTGVNTGNGGSGTDKLDTASCTDTMVSIEIYVQRRCTGDPSTSQITTVSSTMVAGSAPTTVTVQLKDLNGANVTAGGPVVVLTTTAGTLDNGTTAAATNTANYTTDGKYTLMLNSPSTSAVATITGTIDGRPMADNAVIEFQAAGIVSIAPARLVPGRPRQ